MVKKSSPGVGHNGAPAEHGDIRDALALDILFDERKKALAEAHKRARSGFGEKGVSIDQLQALKKMKDDAPSDIEAWLRNTWHYLGALFEPLHEQYELLSPKRVEGPKRAAAFTMGLMAGLYGKPLVVPPGMGGDELQQMTAGHQEGGSRRKGAEEKILASALDPANAGRVTRGTRSAVNEQAAADFAKDQGENPLIVDGVPYETMRAANAARKRLAANPPPPAAAAPVADPPAAAPEVEKEEVPPAPAEPTPARAMLPMPVVDKFDQETAAAWTPEQRAEFRAWAGSLPGTWAPPMSNPAASAYLKLLREGEDYPDAPPVAASPPPAAPAPAPAPKPPTPAPAPPAAVPAPVEAAAPAVGAKPRVKMPNLNNLDDNPENWFAADRREMTEYLDSLSPGHIPPVTHPGFVKFYRDHMAAKATKEMAAASAAPAPAAAPDNFDEASEEELAKQRGRRQEADIPDEDEVRRQAAALKDSGFVEPIHPEAARRKQRIAKGGRG